METLRAISAVFTEGTDRANVAGTLQPNARQGDSGLFGQPSNNRGQDILSAMLTSCISGKGEKRFCLHERNPAHILQQSARKILTAFALLLTAIDMRKRSVKPRLGYQ